MQKRMLRPERILKLTPNKIYGENDLIEEIKTNIANYKKMQRLKLIINESRNQKFFAG